MVHTGFSPMRGHVWIRSYRDTMRPLAWCRCSSGLHATPSAPRRCERELLVRQRRRRGAPACGPHGAWQTSWYTRSYDWAGSVKYPSRVSLPTRPHSPYHWFRQVSRPYSDGLSPSAIAIKAFPPKCSKRSWNMQKHCFCIFDCVPPGAACLQNVRTSCLPAPILTLLQTQGAWGTQCLGNRRRHQCRLPPRRSTRMAECGAAAQPAAHRQ